ncbi:MAG: hypothetical protein J6Y07_03325 [Alphaproteobacteria bacterium]|nr:hypothetical protein [Alphaproteobacteria bacterium]
MVTKNDLIKAKKGMAFRLGLERFDLVTPLRQRDVPVGGPSMGEPIQK